ncbi:retrovirus-related pol polyprotein from transposon TNT 1-94 [Tanacetum coccineum]|uniref:Retrovirus-related pol polyprotein from transposon TNT 1-94 n=1 Tax=Tanacetum coccineum TaxID=301880 RepID=A0ABQ5CCR0_9ASTR
MAAVEVTQTLEYKGGQLNAASVLEKKWLSFCQSLRNTNHVNDSELASLFGKLKYEENLIDSNYETEKKKSLVSATRLSTSFFSSSIVQDFQDSLDDEEDTRSSHEYLNDLEEEYQARALLAKSKLFFNKGTQRFSSTKATDQTKCHKCGKKGHFHKPELRPTKDFKAKYNKVKAKLALLSSSASASKAFMVKNKGLIAEAYEWDEEEVSSDDNEMVEVKVLMALAEENDVVSKEGARNGEWVKISMRKCISEQIPSQKKRIIRVDRLTEDPSNSGQKDLIFIKSSVDDTKVTILDVKRPWLSEAEGFILPNHDTSRILLAESQRNIIDPSFAVTGSSATDYDSIDESSICSTPLPPLKKLDGAEPISGPKNIKSILRPKSTFKAEALKGVIINEPSSAPVKVNKNSSAWVVYSAPTGKLKSVKIKDDPPLSIVTKELNNLKLQFSKNQSSYSRSNQPQQFKRSEALQANKAEALKTTRVESSNANRSKTPTKSGCSRHMTGVKSYLHKFMEQSRPKVVFGDDSTCTTEGYGSNKCNGIVFTKVAFVNGLKYNLISISQLCDAKYIVQFDEKRGIIFNFNKEVVMIALRVRDLYVLDMTSSAQESCFFARASENLNWLWHKRLAHLNFKTINKLAKQILLLVFPHLSTQRINHVHHVKRESNIEPVSKQTRHFLSRNVFIFFTWTYLDLSLVSKAFRVFNTRRQQTKETYHITFDESPEAIKFLKSLVDNINIAESERYLPNEYLHPYDPSQRYQTNNNDLSFIKPYECPKPVVLEIEVSSDQNGQTDQDDHNDQNDQSVQNDEILNDDHSEHSNHTNDEQQIIDNLSNTKDIQILEHLSSPNVEDTSVQNTILILNPSSSILSMVTPAPQDRWSQDKHIELVNVIGNPGARMLTRAMAKELSVASAHECPFVDFLFEEEPKKARLIAQGYNQQEGIDYDETFAPVARLKEIRIYLAFAIYMNFIVYQMDVKSAFLNGKLKEEVCVKQHPGFESNEFPNHVCKLDKALYGLKQAPRAWYLKAMSSAEAEYVVAAGCANITDYDIIYEKVPIFCDNTSAIAISNNLVLHSRTKHIDIRYHFIRDHILKGDIELHFIPTQYQLADIFTKPLDEPTFKRLIVELGMRNIDSKPEASVDYAKIIWEDLIHKLNKKTREKIVPYPSIHNWTLKPNQPEEPPFTAQMKVICNLDVPVESKAPEPSLQIEEVPQVKKPGAKSGLKRKQSSKHTSESKTEAIKSKTDQSEKDTHSSLAKDKRPNHPLSPTPVVDEMHKEAQQAVGGPTSLGATSEEGANPQLSSGMSAFNSSY